MASEIESGSLRVNDFHYFSSVKPTNGRIKQIDTVDFYYSETGMHISDLDRDTDYSS